MVSWPKRHNRGQAAFQSPRGLAGLKPDLQKEAWKVRMRSDAPIHYSLVVPFFNEQENIPTLYMKLTEVMDSIGEPYEMVFVDDGSKDNTYKVLAEIYEHDRRVKDRKSTRLNSSHT